LLARNAGGHEQFNLLFGIRGPFALWNKSMAIADGPDLAGEGRE
jgi:hypothetical protein